MHSLHSFFNFSVCLKFFIINMGEKCMQKNSKNINWYNIPGKKEISSIYQKTCPINLPILREQLVCKIGIVTLILGRIQQGGLEFSFVFFFFFRCLFIYLSLSGLRCDMRNRYSCGMWEQVPDQGSNLGLLHWEYVILGSGSLGKLLEFSLQEGI